MSVIYTIGFSGKTAEIFFELLKTYDIKTLIDIRLNNISQLAGYTKKNDLKYFLNKICNIRYIHATILAPTKDILDAYKSKKISWNEYEKRYLALMKNRNFEKIIKDYDFDRSCLLCSEKAADQCHRRLAADIIKEAFSLDKIVHI